MKIISLPAFKWLIIFALAALFFITACAQPIPHTQETEISEKQAAFTSLATTNSNTTAHKASETIPVKATLIPTFTPTSTSHATSTKVTTNWGNEIISTRTPGVTPTALFIQLDDVPDCVKPGELPHELAITISPFCVFWEDVDSEQGFELILEYADVNKVYEIFVFQTGANLTSLLIPQEFAPRLEESREQCLRRKSFVLKLYAIFQERKPYVTEMAFEGECNLSFLPTATPE
jgi:hypothetical protein